MCSNPSLSFSPNRYWSLLNRRWWSRRRHPSPQLPPIIIPPMQISMRGEGKNGSKNLIEIINFFFFFFLADPFFPDPSIYLSSNTINSALWQSVCTITLPIAQPYSSLQWFFLFDQRANAHLHGRPINMQINYEYCGNPCLPSDSDFLARYATQQYTRRAPRILPAPIRIEPLESICRAFDALSTADIHTTHPSFSWMGFRFGNCRMETGGKGDEGRKSDLVPIDRFFAFRIWIYYFGCSTCERGLNGGDGRASIVNAPI